MPALASGIDYVDLDFLGRPAIIATAILHSTSGVTLVDPGPGSTLPTLERELGKKGIDFKDVRQLLITHIHLDHAGATGAIVERYPHLDVFVHERGAPHMVDPSRLLSSAGRLYGQDMDRLWGEVRPVSAERIRTLKGGEILPVGGREVKVEYTPGHASHHVSFFDAASRMAFVGDTAGIRRGSGSYVMPPTPPPDIDIDAWHVSQRKILAWDPDTLFLTHFGPVHGARQHMQAMFENMAGWSRIIRRLLADPVLDDAQRQKSFTDEAAHILRQRVGDQEAEGYMRAGGLNYSYQGLARYWRKKTA